MRLLIVAITLFCVLGILPGCGESSKSGSKTMEYKGIPRIVPQELVQNGCLNIQTLQNRFEGGSAHYPAIAVTSDFSADIDLSRVKAQFQIFSAFDLREIETENVRFLNNPVQTDCNRVTSRTVSGEQLVFQISQRGENEVSLSLQNPTDSNLSGYRMEGLKNKRQPIRYDVLVLDPTHLRILTTYRGFDPHCRSEKIVISKIQRDYYWASDAAALPSQVLINEAFFRSFLSTLQVEESGNYQIVPQPDGYALVNVNDMRSLLTKSVKEEFSKCVF